MTDKEFRGWVREWFKDMVRERAADNDRLFARMTKLTSTEVNDIVNDKRYPSWKIIAKATENLGVRADEFLIDIVRRAREEQDGKLSGGAISPTPGKPPSPPRTHADERARLLAEAEKRRRAAEDEKGSPPATSPQVEPPQRRRKKSG